MKTITTIDDQELMSQIASDNLEAWAELVRRYSNLVYAIAFQILKSDSDTEDAVQDTFISLKKYANQYDPSQNLRPWLSRVAANQAIRIYNMRKNNNYKESNWMKTQTKTEDSQRLDVASISEKKEVQVLVRKAIDTLPEASRVALTLYFGGEMNQKEIANALGLSQVSISEKIKIGLEKVKVYLNKFGVHSSVVVSSQLIKESLSTTVVPESLFLKLSSQFPAMPKAEAIVSTSQKLAVYSTKFKINFLIFFLIFSAVITVFLGYFNTKNEKTESIPSQLPLIKSTEDGGNKILRNYTPFDFSVRFPFDILKQLDGKSTVASVERDPNKWKIVKSSDQRDILIRDIVEPSVKDGVVLSKVFTKASLIHGFIKLNSENTKFSFSINVSKNSDFEINKMENLFDFASIGLGQVLTFNLFSQKEVEFKIYVWPNQNKWQAIGLIYLDQKHLPEEDYYCWQNFLRQEFMLSFFTDGSVEIRDFGFIELDSSWSYHSEPDLEDAVSKLQKQGKLE